MGINSLEIRRTKQLKHASHKSCFWNLWHSSIHKLKVRAKNFPSVWLPHRQLMQLYSWPAAFATTTFQPPATRHPPHPPSSTTTLCHTHFPFPCLLCSAALIADSASVVVHVINGEHPAAMQHGNSSASCLRLLPATSVPFAFAARMAMTVAAVAWNCNSNYYGTGDWNWNWNWSTRRHFNWNWMWSSRAASLMTGGLWSWSWCNSAQSWMLTAERWTLNATVPA